MDDDIQRERQRRAGLGARYQVLSAEMTALFFRIDPAGINFETNVDEYDLEVGTVLPRLAGAQDVGDVSRIVEEEFDHWFSVGHCNRADLIRVAAELWPLYQNWKGLSQPERDRARRDTGS